MNAGCGPEDRRASAGVCLVYDKTENRSVWLSTMDIIHHCLSLALVPYLTPAFGALSFIWSSVKPAKGNWRLSHVQSIAHLLKILNGEYRRGRLLEAKTWAPLADLCRFVMFVCP